MDGITKFPLKALEFYCHVKTVPQFTENLVIFLLVFNQQRENTWSTMGPFQEYEVSQDFCMLTQSFKKKRTSVVWRNWGSVPVIDVVLSRKRSHQRKEALAAASHVWSSITCGQRTNVRPCRIHLSLRRRGKSVTSAQTTPKGPSAPIAFVQVR